MATFNNSGAYSILNTQKGTYYVQGGHYFSPATFVDLGTTAPSDYQSLSSERSDLVNIGGGAIDGVTIGANSTINASISNVTNATITNPTLTGGTINNTPIGQTTAAAGAFTNLSASGTVSGNGFSAYLASPPAIGFTTPGTGAFTSLNATSASILGALSAEGINSTGNGQAASPTNTGTNLSSTFSALTFFDSSRLANNKTSEIIWSSGLVTFRFKNDAGGSVLPWLIVAGGQAAGITSINSSSGSGSWVHTGAYSASGAINSSVGLTVKEGANAKQGVATLVAGTVTVSNTSVTANSRIFLTVQSLGTVTKPQAVGVTARTAGTSFVITSFDATDTSVIAYEIFEPGS